MIKTKKGCSFDCACYDKLAHLWPKLCVKWQNVLDHRRSGKHHAEQCRRHYTALFDSVCYRKRFRVLSVTLYPCKHAIMHLQMNRTGINIRQVRNWVTLHYLLWSYMPLIAGTLGLRWAIVAHLTTCFQSEINFCFDFHAQTIVLLFSPSDLDPVTIRFRKNTYFKFVH